VAIAVAQALRTGGLRQGQVSAGARGFGSITEQFNIIEATLENELTTCPSKS
jgi:hypothetical protein